MEDRIRLMATRFLVAIRFTLAAQSITRATGPTTQVATITIRISLKLVDATFPAPPSTQVFYSSSSVEPHSVE